MAVGQPYVKGASVTAVIEQLTLVCAVSCMPVAAAYASRLHTKHGARLIHVKKM